MLAAFFARLLRRAKHETAPAPEPAPIDRAMFVAPGIHLVIGADYEFVFLDAPAGEELRLTGMLLGRADLPVRFFQVRDRRGTIRRLDGSCLRHAIATREEPSAATG